VDAYVMRPRSVDAIQADWRAIDPNALVVTSPRNAQALIDAIGMNALSALDIVVAIGDTTREAIHAWPVRQAVAPEADLSTLEHWWATVTAIKDAAP
ncbi:MAG: uroporphyrinogen-III synthase, partial [Acidobacteria bacterium]|nr:uroporphyrinogen-III synthase [Acidobacteriota bacterium]